MSGLCTIFSKECKCLAGSDRGVFILYAVLVISWGFFLAGGGESQIDTGPLWLVFFSVVVAANFSNTVFISERVSGSLEVLITSGFSRKAILFGKMMFVILMSLGIGVVCMGMAEIWHKYFYEHGINNLRVYDFLIYAASVYVNTAGSAFLSVRMSNPRLLHLANFFLLACIMMVYIVMAQFYSLPEYVLPLFLALVGSLSLFLAVREFNSERILQPVIF